MKKCKVEGCNGVHRAKGYCSKHYAQYKRHGEVSERTKYDLNEIIEYDDYAEIILYNRQGEEISRALIDLDDIEKVRDYKWGLSNYYVYNKKINIYLHRLIMDCPDDMMVDHIDHNKLDNRKSNLRICTQQQNNMNISLRSHNTSGYSGIYHDKSNNRFRARITYNKNVINLGSFKTLEEAIEARKKAELEYFGEYRNQEDEE